MKGWEHRFTPSRPEFAQRFLSGRQNIILHFRTREDSAELWAAVFQQVFNRNTIPGVPICGANNISLHREQQAVLTEVIQLMQPKKRFVSALVRLERIKEFYRLRPEELFVTLEGFFVTGFALANWEVDPPKLPFCGLRTMRFRHLIGQMVQGSAQVMNDISSSGERVERDEVGEERPWRLLSGLHLHLHARKIVAASDKNRLHLEEILFGPLNLCTDQN